jgi:hypothetical protein
VSPSAAISPSHALDPSPFPAIDPQPAPRPSFSTPDPAALRFCREADSVIEGFLCSEPLVVSNACRKPKSFFDAYICDEPRMHALQRKVWELTEWAIRTVVTALLGRGSGPSD